MFERLSNTRVLQINTKRPKTVKIRQFLRKPIELDVIKTLCTVLRRRVEHQSTIVSKTPYDVYRNES